MTHNPCLICDRIGKIRSGKNPYFVRELETGYVVIGDYQFFRGYTLFLSKTHVRELHELAPAIRQEFLREMSLVAEAVHRAFAPRKLNYELLGNANEHLHWHLFPRHADDPAPEGPVWIVEKSLRSHASARPSPEMLADLKDALNASLSEVLAQNPKV